MAKWEYLSAYVEATVNFNLYSSVRKVRAINGNELDNWKNGLSVYEYFDQLGEQGWEMISVPPSGEDGHEKTQSGFFWFKRQIS